MVIKISKIYAIDFDGTLCKNKYPDIGNPIIKNIDFVKDLKESGEIIVLWTCRSGEYLEDALEWCKEKNIEFDYVNENTDENIDKFQSDSRKIFADYYLDDKNIILDESGVIGLNRKTRDKKRLTKIMEVDLKTRAEGDNEKYIEGYFAVFNRETELWPGAFEEIESNAFDNTLGNDIRALINHDTGLVLGRNKANTLELKTDSKGLWGNIKINQNDSDAVNLYERVKRGDVNQCSFGFNILNEEVDFRDDGSVKWTIKEIDLHEVSVVTFPAYEDTGVQARKKEVEQHNKRQLEVRKNKLKERLDNVKTINDSKES